MTRRKVIFVPADYWTDPPQPEEPPMTTSRKATLEENEAALALLAVIEASQRGDQHAINVVLDEWRDNLGPVLQFATALLSSLITQCCDEPRILIGSMRKDLINGMASR